MSTRRWVLILTLGVITLADSGCTATEVIQKVGGTILGAGNKTSQQPATVLQTPDRTAETSRAIDDARRDLAGARPGAVQLASGSRIASGGVRAPAFGPDVARQILSGPGIAPPAGRSSSAVREVKPERPPQNPFDTKK